MKVQKSAQSSLQFYCQNQFHLKSKIALLTLDRLKHSYWAEILLLIYEYAQLLSQGLLLYSSLFHQTNGKNFLERVIVYFFKLVDPSSLLEFEGSSSVAWTVIIMMLVFTGLKYFLAIYVVCVAQWNLEGPGVFLSIWRWVFQVQGRFLYYFMTSFWTFTILNIQNEGSERIQEDKAGIITMLSILIGIEFTFSFFMETQFCNLLPGKNFLSAKNYEMQVLTMAQKFMLQVLQLSLNSEAFKTFWIFSVVNLFFSVWRVERFYQKLPLYKGDALALLGSLINLVLALNIVNFIGVILKAGDWFEMTMQSIVILWMFLGLFAVYINRGLLFIKTLKLISYQDKYHPNLLLTKIILTKELEKKAKLPFSLTIKYHAGYLLQNAQNANFMENSNYDENKSWKDTYRNYFEDHLLKCKKDPLIKLYLAKQWFKRFGIISKALKMVGDIQNKPWSKEYTSYLLLISRIQTMYFSKEKGQESLFNFVEYMENQKLLSELKSEMVKQAQLKVNVCKNILSEVPDLGEIFENAQVISKLKKTTQKKIDRLMETSPDYYVSYLLLCSKYYLMLEYSSNKSQKYQEIYAQRVLRYEKYFSSSSIMKENVYQDVNAFFILRGEQKTENGIIKYCSKSVEILCGGDRQSYISSHISILFMPSMQSFYRDFFQSILDKGDMSLLQNVQRAFLHNKKGYMFEANFYLWIHPYITESLCLDLLMRPVKSQNEYLLIKTNGDIEGATERVSKDLRISPMILKSSSSSAVSIKLLSEELFDANQAFNTVGRVEMKKENKNQQEFRARRRGKRITQTPDEDSVAYVQALELFSSFSTGKEVMMFPLESGKLGIKYHCQIVKISTGPTSPKLIILAKAHHNDEGEEEYGKIHHKTQNDNLNLPGESEGDEKNLVMLTTTSPRALLINCNLSTERNALFSAKSTSQAEGETEVMTPWKKMVQYNFVDQKDMRSKSRETNGTEEDLRDFISTSINSLKASGEKQSYKALKKTLDQKTYSNFFKILCTGFYTIFIITLLSQLLLKEISDDTMDDLVVKKNLLNYAQTRSYYACKMPYAIGGAYLMSISIEVQNFLPNVYIPPKTAVGLLLNYYKNLVAASANITKLLGTLDETMFDKLFQKDVRMIGSVYDINDETFINVTSFQAVSDLGVPVRYLNDMQNPGISEGRAAYTFIRRNVADDFLSKNLEITEIFQDSVNEQRDYLKFFVSLCTILSPLLLVAVALSLGLILWIQYSKEKQYLLAFVKLHPSSIKLTLENVESFKQALVNDDSFEDRKVIEYFWNKSHLLEKLHITGHYYKRDLQTASTKKMKKRYFLFIIQMVIYIGLLIGVLLWNFITAQHSLDMIYHKQTQLQQSNYISERVSINMMGMIEMFISNNTFNITHIPPLNHNCRGG